MKKLGIILTIGISNSGKTTFTREFVKENPMYTDINRDDMRVAFFCGGDQSEYVNYKFSQGREQMITTVAEVRARCAITSGQGVIISDTNLNATTRDFWKAFAEEHNVPYEEKIFPVDLHVALARNRKRPITLPPRVIRQQYVNFRKFMGLPFYEPNESLPEAVICDLDGTFCIHNGRTPFEYDKVSTDLPDQDVWFLLDSLRDAGTEILFFTGREDKDDCRKDTLDWLAERGHAPTVFEMRERGDSRPDVQVKEEFLWKHADDYNITLALDDRNQVVDLWRTLGIKCWQVSEGDF
jgi:predicted kinase